MTLRQPRSWYVPVRVNLVAITIIALALLALCCSSSSAISPPSKLTLRVRMPDGAVKRVEATTGDTVDGLMGRLDMDEGTGAGLSREAGGDKVEEGRASVGQLGLGNGDFLYVKVRVYGSLLFGRVGGCGRVQTVHIYDQHRSSTTVAVQQ